MARRLWSSVTVMYVCALTVLCMLLIGARSGRASHNHNGVVGADRSGRHSTNNNGNYGSGVALSPTTCQTLKAKFPDQYLDKCPIEQICEDDGTNIDCSKRGLKQIPGNIPLYTTELRFEQNLITEVATKAFTPYNQLRRIDLSKNNITKIAANAFSGLKSLNSLFLFGNEITALPEGIFKGLSTLQLLLLNANRIKCIRRGTFDDLSSLNLLSLYDNNIQSLAEGIFTPLVNIQTLHLGRNPFICDCNLKWLADYLHKHPGVETTEARCEEPKRNARKRVSQLSQEKFKCKGFEELKSKYAAQCLVDTKCPDGCVCDGNSIDCSKRDVEPNDFKCSELELEMGDCGPESFCPSRCTCTGSIVRCSRQKLRAFPRHIKPITTDLYLDVNDISVIPQEVNQLIDLTRLDLSNNQIAVLPDNILSNLTYLQTLILSYNKLQCIQPEAFRGLKSLKVLSLHGNDISTIPDGAFNDLVSISHIAMGANPLYCDCNLRWLAERIQKGFVEGGIARCYEPRSMRDKLIISAPPSHFVCANISEPDPQILAKCDACYTFPCANGATCFSKPILNYECQCAPAYYGHHCEYKIDACFGNPCDNGATCKVLEMGRFSCHCPQGFDGNRCETNINDCVANKCENNATCVDQIESYRCECQPGFSGDYCERKINYCGKEYNPCKNGATCVDHFSNYQCVCPLGWSGQNCTENENDCVDHLCQNGGTCVDSVNTYRCDCPIGFSGKFCELAPVVELYPQTSPCQQHDCKHGVCFLPSGSNDYICKCSAGYTGKLCEMMSSISFRDGSYLEFDPLKTAPMVNVTLKFATRKQYGVLLYTGDSQHLAVELFKGRIRISLDVGNYPVSTMFSYETVSDGRYHEVELLLIKKNFTMRVDGGSARTIINEGANEYLQTKQSLYFGGFAEHVAANAVKNWHIWNSSSLEGCMREIYINGLPPDLSQARRQHLVLPGCAEFDDINKPCLNNMCQKGKCVATSGGSSSSDHHTYECVCRGGYSGPYCDQAPTCQKEIKRDFYYENDCRSTKKLKLASCVGTCGDNCCKPIKSKKRSVRMACSDGSKFNREIEIVRKCGCNRKC